MFGRKPAASRLTRSLMAAAAGLALTAGAAAAQEAYGAYGYDGATGATYAPQPAYAEPAPLAGGYYGQDYGQGPAPGPAYGAPGYAGQAYGNQGYADQGYADQAYANQAYVPGAYAGTTLDDITVYAPRSRSARSSTTGAPIEWVSLSRAVTYSDLDLSTQWGVDELMRRVRGAARSACSQIDFMHPIATSDSPPCYRDAMSRATRDVEVAIASTPYRQARW